MADDSTRNKKKGESAASSSATANPENKRKKDGPSANRVMADVNRAIHALVTPSPPQSTPTDLNIKQLATEVANRINPTIEAALDKVINKIHGLAAQFTSKTDSTSKMEERVSSLEDNDSSSNNKPMYISQKNKGNSSHHIRASNSDMTSESHISRKVTQFNKRDTKYSSNQRSRSSHFSQLLEMDT
ncbi:hypothetical protein XELAEV_18004570mg [Xenopus laevis]|uniref:Uncharacterized protein n=1 Tax=Xenopus laevis TaxID=8355 RepID=A0A974BR87_XENLA|nr:hypothetical protein XELAEV_18004570mg [Xenopus laevis]